MIARQRLPVHARREHRSGGLDLIQRKHPARTRDRRRRWLRVTIDAGDPDARGTIQWMGILQHIANACA